MEYVCSLKGICPRLFAQCWCLGFLLHASFIKVLVESVSLSELVLDAYILSIHSPQNRRQFYKERCQAGLPVRTYFLVGNSMPSDVTYVWRPTTVTQRDTSRQEILHRLHEPTQAAEVGDLGYL